MTIHPLQSMILCQVHEGKKTNRIHIPDDVQVQPYAEILEIGPTCTFAKVGMKILCNPSVAVYADTINGKKLMIVHESACFAEWKETEKETVPFS